MNLKTTQAVVEFDPNILKCDNIATVISDMGYIAGVQKEFKHSSACIQPSFSSNHLNSSVIQVEGMVCINCAQIIELNLRKMKGIKQISVSNEEKVAHVVYDTNVLSIQNICSAIEDLGFEAYLPTSTQVDYVLSTLSEMPHSVQGQQLCVIRIEGMTCSSCVELIESKLGDLEAVKSIQVMLEEKEARIAYSVDVMTPKEIAAQICDLGYTVTEVDGRCVYVSVAVQPTEIVHPLGIALRSEANGTNDVISPEGIYTITFCLDWGGGAAGHFSHLMHLYVKIVIICFPSIMYFLASISIIHHHIMHFIQGRATGITEAARHKDVVVRYRERILYTLLPLNFPFLCIESLHV